MPMDDLFISGLGTYLPDTVSVAAAVDQGLYPAEKAEQHGWTGVAIAGDVPAPEMALQASQEAFKRAGRDPESVDLLFYADCWHQGPDGWLPQFYLQHHLVGADPLSVEIRHGCAGVLSAFELAAGYLAVDPGRQSALIVASDNFGTPLVDRWSVGAGFIAGDAAAAVVLTKTPGFARLLSVGTTSAPAFEEIHRAGEPLFPPGVTEGAALDFDRRLTAFRQRQLADGKSANGAAALEKKAMVCLARALSQAGIELKDIARVALPNSSREEAEGLLLAPLKLPLSASTWEFGRTIGHTGAADQLLGLDHLLATGQVGPGDHVLLLALGPGITFSCAVVKILETPPWMA